MLVLLKFMEQTVAEGLEQTSAHVDLCGMKKGYCGIFDGEKPTTCEEMNS